MGKSSEHWVIRVYDGLELKNEYRRPKGYWSEIEMERILARLACMFLSAEEILNASQRRSSRFRSALLEVKTSNNAPVTMTVGQNPYVVATVEVVS